MARRWSPVLVLAFGAFLTVGPDRQRALPLAMPLGHAVGAQFETFLGTDIPLSDEERTVAGVTDYLSRDYRRDTADSTVPAAFGVYVGYYASQAHGRTIHSPRNCLPGAGWEPLDNQVERITGPDGGSIAVNRYLLQNGAALALVVYWYQGRSRVAANEYAVKWDLLRDAALRGRTEEALVRVVVPIAEGGEAAAWALARRVSEQLVQDVARALPR